MSILQSIADLPMSLTLASRTKTLAERVIRRHMHSHFDDTTRNGEDWIASTLAPSCRSFVDVGGNEGNFTSCFLANSPKAHGWIFEPAASACAKLRTRFRDDWRVKILAKAVSDRSCRMSFFEEPNAGLSSSLVKACAVTSAKQIEVEVTTLDVELGCQEIDFVKIDAEGHDLAVLRGGSSLLGSQSIRFLQFEYHSTWLHSGATLCAALDLLASFGYRTYLLKGAALYELHYHRYGEYFYYSNYFAVRQQDAAALKPLTRSRI